jgi:hypothetical protein
LYATNPWWSPDGKWVVFSNMREDGNFDIVVIDSHGGPMATADHREQQSRAEIYPATAAGSGLSAIEPAAMRSGVCRFCGKGAEVQFTHEGRRAPQESPERQDTVLDRRNLNLHARSTTGGQESPGLTRVMAIRRSG